jgi:hypothetical protein
MSPSPLVSAGFAADILQVGRQQLDKLIDCGLLGAPQLTPGGQRRLELATVLNLASRQSVVPPPHGQAPDLAVHLGPLRQDPDGKRNQRTHLGWHQSPAGLTPKQVENAWAGLWNCDPDLYRESALIGDVAGFVVALAAITGSRRISGRVRFTLARPTPDMIARYANRRFTPVQGGLVQPIRPAQSKGGL